MLVESVKKLRCLECGSSYLKRTPIWKAYSIMCESNSRSTFSEGKIIKENLS